jgi:hypothetical protein
MVEMVCWRKPSVAVEKIDCVHIMQGGQEEALSFQQ